MVTHMMNLNDDPCNEVTDTERKAAEKWKPIRYDKTGREMFDVSNEDGAIVLKNDGTMYILASNDVRVNLYMLATQKLLSENKQVQQLIADEINKMLYETTQEMRNEEKLLIETDTGADDTGKNSK